MNATIQIPILLFRNNVIWVSQLPNIQSLGLSLLKVKALYSYVILSHCESHCEFDLRMILRFIHAEICVIHRGRRLSTNRGLDKSQYHTKTEFKNCFMIYSKGWKLLYN